MGEKRQACQGPMLELSSVPSGRGADRQFQSCQCSFNFIIHCFCLHKTQLFLRSAH